MRLKDENKFAAIIQATLELASEKGLAGIKMTELAKRAGIATGSLYTYFDDKQDLLVSVNREVWQQASTFLRKGRRKENNGIAEALQELIGLYTDWTGKNRQAMVFVDLMKRSPYHTEAVHEETVRQYGFLIELILAGQSSGILRQCDPVELLAVINATCKAVIDHHLQANQTYSSSVRERCWEYVWGAIRHTGGS